MPTRNSFTLEVRITGICLFVPEPDASTPQVTVLMPHTSDADGHKHGAGHEHDAADEHHRGIEPHRTVLIHDRKFAGSPCGEHERNWCLHELGGFELKLANGSAAHVGIPGVYQLNRPGCNRKANLGAAPATQVAAKVILQSGYCEHVPPGARFRVDGAITRMAYEVHWVIPDMDDSTLTLESLDGSPAKSIALHVHEGDRVVLYVRCVPEGEIWPDTPHSVPNTSIPVPHFAELQKLLVPGLCPVDVPTWQKNQNNRPFGRSSAFVGTAAPIGNPYTCMPGQAPGGP